MFGFAFAVTKIEPKKQEGEDPKWVEIGSPSAYLIHARITIGWPCDQVLGTFPPEGLNGARAPLKAGAATKHEARCVPKPPQQRTKLPNPPPVMKAGFEVLWVLTKCWGQVSVEASRFADRSPYHHAYHTGYCGCMALTTEHRAPCTTYAPIAWGGFNLRAARDANRPRLRACIVAPVVRSPKAGARLTRVPLASGRQPQCWRPYSPTLHRRSAWPS